MDARKFFLVCAGILCLAVAYNLGASSTRAQGVGGQFVALSVNPANTSVMAALTNSGDVWRIDSNSGYVNPVYVGNILGGPAPVEARSFGKTKAQHR